MELCEGEVPHLTMDCFTDEGYAYHWTNVYRDSTLTFYLGAKNKYYVALEPLSWQDWQVKLSGVSQHGKSWLQALMQENGNVFHFQNVTQ